MAIGAMLLQMHSQILLSLEISTSQMLLSLPGSSAHRFRRCKSPSRGGRSIRRTTRVLAQERGHVGVTVLRQESVLARVWGRRRATASPHTGGCGGPACIDAHTVSKRSMPAPRPTRRKDAWGKQGVTTERTCTSQYPPPRTRRRRRTRLGARARLACV